ncbi:solute carrier family 35 member F6-like [Mercenaria mercenaria]|uniref:solute carrier family 35 member F6-like n=1 Tax=Mercenaria mercenaria TaxID=6596 RepID=UPI00234ED405|nr:solute carrier family 35 member F6-like [Mercenaria mercenaria]XP_053377760.1 solute carrier family 35 member F6-like [Mercenaria mercenaria]XP_053377771.1 solute carrier family 35 member F6-like [Mercenaria mercenaria]
MARLTCMQMVLTAGMLVTGSINTLCKKAQNDCVVKGYKSNEHSFNHPWFQTWMLCTAQALCLIGLPIQRRRNLQEYRKEIAKNEVKDVQIKIETGPPVHARLCQWILIIPSCCSLISTSLCGIGLLYVDASIMLMLRGSVIIFTGICSVIFLKRKLKVTHWLGMIIVIVGLVLAGCSSVLKGQGHKTIGGNTITGIILIVVAQVIIGGQITLKEAVLKKRNLHPLHIVGMGGIYGFTLMSFIVLPVLYFIPGDNIHGSYENSIDALYQISNSYQLMILCLVYITSVAFYNYFSMAILRTLTAVHKTLIDACRTVFVWGVGLTIYYGFDKNFGEPFDKAYGILQVDGFLFLMIGTAMYNQLLDLRNFLPCYSFQSEEIRDVPYGFNQQSTKQDVTYNVEKSDNENTKLLTERN